MNEATSRPPNALRTPWNAYEVLSKRLTTMSKENTYTLLDAIHYPADLRRLNLDQLPEVCRELRQDIINELGDLSKGRDTSPPVWVWWN